MAINLPIVSKYDDKGAKEAQSSLERLGDKIKGIGKAAVIAAGVAGVGALAYTLTKGFERLQSIENATNKLEGLGHTAAGVEQIMDSALKAVKGTAFGLGDAANLAATAVAAGVKPGQELEKYLRLAGDAATIAGSSLDEMGNIMNKVRSMGKANNEVLQQLAERGIPIYQMLADQLGVTAEEVFKLATQGEISAAMFETAMEEKFGGAALKAGETVQGAFANMQAAFGRLGAAMLGPFYEELPAILGDITAFVDEITAKVQILVDVFELAGGGLEGVRAVFQKIGDEIAAFFTSGGFAQAITSAAEMRNQLFDAVINAIPGIIDALLSAIPMILDGALRAFEGIMTALTTVIPKVITGITDMLPKIVASIVEWLPKIIDSAVALFSGLITGLLEAIPILINALVGMISPIISAIMQLLPAIITAGIELFLGLVTAVVQAIPIILAEVMLITPKIIMALMESLPALMEGAFNFFIGIVTALVETLPKLIEAFILFMPTFFQTLVDALPEMIKSAVQMFTGMVTGFIEMMPRMITTIIELLPTIIEQLIMFLPNLITAAIELFTGIVTGLIEAWPLLMDELDKARPQIAAAFEKAKPQLIEAGKQLLAGLASGLLNDMPRLLGSIAKTIGSALINSVKKILGIASPSKVFMGIGENVTLGLVNGLAAGEAAVGKAIGSIGDVVGNGFSADVAVSGSAASSASLLMGSNRAGNVQSGNYITINVNGGLDSSAAIGEAVVTAIRKYERSSGPVFVRA